MTNTNKTTMRNMCFFLLRTRTSVVMTSLIATSLAQAIESNSSSVIYGHAPIGSLTVAKTIAPGGTIGKLQPGATLAATPSLTDEDGDEAAPYIVQYQWVQPNVDDKLVANVRNDAWQTLDISSPMSVTLDKIGFHIVMKFEPKTLTGVPDIGVAKYWSSAKKVIDGDKSIDIDEPTGPVEPVLPNEGSFSVAVGYESGEKFTDVSTKSPGIYPNDGSDLNPIVGSVWRATITCDANILPSMCTADNFTYQWKVMTDNGAIDATGSGAKSSTYTINAEDQGKKIFVEVNPKKK
ncbi:hypothetical protein GL273_01245 [Aeromonas jandaei]|uniref:hypothetical protein n=1 Tax=Aeromonas jandaei TaxID=650 RepID=UPI001C5AF55D|nr:hypothetical protein [Aeromonas jandaei]MBW3804452.1 hypothetical protein [Aeromonas jandaei]